MVAGMANRAAEKQYELKEVCIRLKEGHPLYSEKPVSTPAAAIEVMRKEMSQYDREVLCVVNLDTRLKPINFHVVSVGELDTSIAYIPNILKTGILSNARSFMILHNHPSGNISPSKEDIQMTKQLVEAGKIIGLPCTDHIIIGARTGDYLSMREWGSVDFNRKEISMTAEQVLHVGEPGTAPRYRGKGEMAGNERNAEMQVPDFVKDADAEAAAENESRSRAGGAYGEKREEVTIKFGKGLAEPFTGKNGKEYTRILIPNVNPGDTTPWASFVLPSKYVHENQYGKGLWVKIPADGKTIISKPTLAGERDGKNIWEKVKSEVSNLQLKAMVEAYKNRSPQTRGRETRASVRTKVDALARDKAAEKTTIEKPKRAGRDSER